MRSSIIIIAITLCMAMPIASCGKKEETEHMSESVEALDDVEQNTVVPSIEDQKVNPVVPDATSDNTTENISSESEADTTLDNGADSISEDQAYAAVINYCKATIPDFSDVTGDTYVTELVPGIIDDEQRTGETFNVRDYLMNP